MDAIIKAGEYIAKINLFYMGCQFFFLQTEYLDFPHAFSLEISYRLSDAGLEQRTKITNLSS